MRSHAISRNALKGLDDDMTRMIMPHNNLT
jgi:hypothetical protein